MKFTLEIELRGAMQTYGDIAGAVRHAAFQCDDLQSIGADPAARGNWYEIRDRNGTPAGKWEVTAGECA